MSIYQMWCPYCAIHIDEKICHICGRDCTAEDVEVVHNPYNPKHIRKERSCFRCKKMFMSEWSGDRICSPCNEKEIPHSEEHNLNL